MRPVPDVVPLIAGRGRRRRVVAAICPRCVNPAPTSGATMPLLVGFAALALASLWVWSVPGRPSGGATTAIALSWAVAVIAYGVQAARAGWAARHGASGALRSWRWAVPPLLGALVAVAVLVALPLRVRFALSRAAIASEAEDASPGVGRHGRLVAYPSGLVQRADGSTAVLVDARCGFFRADPAGEALGGGVGSAAAAAGGDRRGWWRQRGGRGWLGRTGALAAVRGPPRGRVAGGLPDRARRLRSTCRLRVAQLARGLRPHLPVGPQPHRAALGPELVTTS